jgi:hypothetical protein
MKHIGCLIILLSAVSFAGAFAVHSASEDPSTMLPASVEGWKAAHQDQKYDRNTLFDYIDGGAELYLSYGFKSLTSRTYSKTDQPDIIVDIFDMTTSQNAFGVFSHTRETMDSTFGQGCQYVEGLLLFWKDNYYVSILSSLENPELKKAVFALARHIDAAIPTEGPLPEIISLLPSESLVPESIRYFHNHVWLNSYYFIADENIFEIDERTEAVLAKYGEPGKRQILLLIQYDSEDHARRGQAGFLNLYLPGQSRKSAARIEDGTWTACKLDGTLLAVVFAAPQEQPALDLLNAVHR